MRRFRCELFTRCPGTVHGGRGTRDEDIGPMEVGLICEESIVLELDEHAEELQHVFDNISGVHLDPELLQVSRQAEIDIMGRLNVCRRRTSAFPSFLRSRWT